VTPSSRRIQNIGSALVLGALGLAYLLLAKLGLAVASLHPSASPIWPPSGLALASCLLWGNRVWPAIASGAFFANAITFGSITTSMAIAIGNTLEGVVTASLVSRWCTRDEPFATPARVVVYSAVTFAPGTVLSATVGVGSLVLTGYADPSKFGDIWFTWWLGDVGGQLVVAPIIVLWANANIFAFGRNELVRMAWLMAATIAVGLVAFSPLMEQTPRRGVFAFLAIVPLLWAALRYSQRDTATVAFLLSSFAIWGTLENNGPFAGANLNDSFLLLLMFVISTALPNLVLSADVSARRRAQMRQALLVREFQHRIKNVLAVVQSIVDISVARGRELESAGKTLAGRLQALARAQDHVTSTANGVPMRDLVSAELAPFGSRWHIDGAPLVVGSNFAQKLALVLHELATNAAKYGSLSKPEGRVIVSWRIEQSPKLGELLKFSWVERGGPIVEPPAEQGFGMQLITELLGNAPSISFESSGFEFAVEVPVLEVVEGSD
jgi:two-component sensor histidine kinase/integral membrane sensor domain MASE1